MRPVFQDLKGLSQNFGAVRGHFQHVNGFIERSIGIDLRAEFHADRFEIVDQFLFGKVFCPVERHVLAEMGQPLLVVILKNRTGIDGQTQFGAVLRFSVNFDVIVQSILELSVNNARINGNRCAQIDRTLRRFGLRIGGIEKRE